MKIISILQGAIRCLISLTFVCFFGCQKNDSERSFNLKGNVKAEIDSIYVYPGFADMKYIDSVFYRFSSPVKNGAFNFIGEIPHPYMLFLYSRSGASEYFFIENGDTDLSISLINGDRNIQISSSTKSKTQIEYEALKVKSLNAIDSLMVYSKTEDDYNEYKEQKDSVLIEHLKKHPDSYVALWYFINEFSRYSNYKKVYEESLPYFSDEIKKSKAFQVFKESVIKSKEFSFKNQSFNLKNIALDESVFSIRELMDEQYVLLDFWFSHCAPCLKEMPKYIPIYEEFKDRGFEIVSISVDETKDIDDWKNVIHKNGFIWKHYLDENGAVSKKLNVTSFPTTFLLNSEGDIIQRDISALELKKFLNDSLN